ncbi:hypothetical protein K2X85_20400 [bacterium]|nr:hypothetical protein [bacterium]
MYPHVIHLRGPWELDSGVGDPRQALSMPCSWAMLPSVQTGHRLRRSFQWVKPPQPHERVYLGVEGAPPGTVLHLGSKEIGITRSIWEELRVDVTELLRPRNDIDVRVGPITEGSEHDFSFASDVRLIVTSASLADARIHWQWDEPTSTQAIAGRLILDESCRLPPGSVVQWELNDQLVGSRTLEEWDPTKSFGFAIGPVTGDPWRPLGLGLPIRHQLRWQIRRNDQLFWHEERSIGLRRIEAWGRDNQLLRIGGEYESGLPDTIIDAPSILDQEHWREVLLRSAGRISLSGRLASDELYDWADRRGVIIDHDCRGNEELRQAIQRQSHHPSVVIRG